MKLTKVQSVVGIVVSSIVIFGSLFGLNAYVAKAKDLNYVSMRLEQKIQDDRIDRIVQRMRDIEAYYNGSNDVTIMTPADGGRYQEYQLDLDRVMREIERLDKRYE